MQYNFCGADPHVNVHRGVFRTKWNIYDGASLWKSQKSYIVDVQLGSKYASGISSTVGKVYRMSIFKECRKSTLSSKKFVIDFLVTWINKKQAKLGSSDERNLLI